ncbi:unnamed protein product, partial [Mesorhabditis belari]|uniref:C-type lectin domain-containing protein n=1 Tax=Mesorhabditis belari TaxID=2138241 RepID=A0AAF3JC50_9BILA
MALKGFPRKCRGEEQFCPQEKCKEYSSLKPNLNTHNMLKRFLFLTGLLVGVFATDECSDATCPDGWYYSQTLNNCYKAVTQPGGFTFAEADATCKSAGGQLTSIHSAEEDRIVLELGAMPGTVTRLQTLIGGYRPNGTWTWSDGTPFDYKNFAKTDDAKQCLQLWSTNSTAIHPINEYKQWDDIPCTAKFVNAVCKISLGGNQGQASTPAPVQPSAPPAPTCPPTWYYAQTLGNCYKAVTQTGGLTFAEADAMCKTAGGQLTSIHSAEEDRIVLELGAMPGTVTRLQTLIGGYRPNGTWTWSDGTPFDYKNFANTDDAKQCLQLWSTNSTAIHPINEYKQWDDIPCTAKFVNAVCKISFGGNQGQASTPAPVQPSAPPAPTCPPTWYYAQNLGNCYKAVTQTGGLTFAEADTACKTAGGQLTSIHSAEEDRVVLELSAAPGTVTRYQTLIGGQRPNGTWTWSDGTPFDYKNLANTDDAKQCLQLWSTNSTAIHPINEYKQWDDIPCTAKFVNAVCKIVLPKQQPTTPPSPQPAKVPYCSADWSGPAFDSCYKVITQTGGFTFDQGDQKCKELGGQLASIHSAAEDKYMMELSNQGKPIGDIQTLIGGQRTGPHSGDWKWSDNTPWDYTNWSASNPNNQNGIQGCIQVLSSQFGANPPWWFQFQTWDDLQCNIGYQAAVCKRPQQL